MTSGGGTGGRDSTLRIDESVSTRERPATSGPADDVSARPLGEIMTREIFSVAPDSPIADVVSALVSRGFGGAPVVDEQRGVLGIVTASDLLRFQLEQTQAEGDSPTPLGSLTAKDVMTASVLTAPETVTVPMAAAMMATERVHRLIVIDAADRSRVVGIVSALDVMRWLAADDGYIVP